MNETLINDILTHFHFLRPEWFYALIPALLLFLLIRYRHSHHSNWEKAIEPHLLDYILDNPNEVVSRSPLAVLFIAWIIATIALAGPVWRKTPQPVHEREDALVVIFDLTRSMLATDVKPDRLIRAKRKLIDLLETREEGVTGLVVFAGDAHTVSPLTDDTNTIAAMIPALSPDIVPAPGSRLSSALERAVELFEQGGVASGRMLIITDEIRDVVAAQRVARQYRNAYPVSVMSVGTADGAPVPLYPDQPNAGFLKDGRGNLVIPKLDVKNLRDFAELAGGRYSPMSLTDEDLEFLLAEQPLTNGDAYRELERDFDVWFEEGPWLLLLLLPLASLAFRRGWVWSIALITLLPTDRAQAFGWEDLWQTKDQQGISALKTGDVARAAVLFENEAWKATANYRSENFEDAANQFGNVETADAQYNLGNALAKQSLLNEAIEAYDQALTLDPDNEDARFNKELIEKLLEQQEQQQQKQQQGDNQEQDQQNEEDQQDQQENQQDQEKNDQEEQQDQQQTSDKDQEKQSEEQEEQEQQEQEQQKPQDAKSKEASEKEEDPLDEEEKQALQQWLRRVPDDPGGLLRRKFQQQHEQRAREGKVAGNDASADW
ncbi:MAG: VWA domain-containing protein [Gammaproteobacteria bacterium]|jgi:Ca-activated chloride channel homolog|nr:VWA domain-containing protein [Gammaproteobacteria bacterium]MBT4495098.1 VWA domain-containing protein [Gammaproteobacteria bacterium]